jgi:hypothetical protein
MRLSSGRVTRQSASRWNRCARCFLRHCRRRRGCRRGWTHSTARLRRAASPADDSRKSWVRQASCRSCVPSWTPRSSAASGWRTSTRRARSRRAIGPTWGTSTVSGSCGPMIPRKRRGARTCCCAARRFRSSCSTRLRRFRAPSRCASPGSRANRTPRSSRWAPAARRDWGARCDCACIDDDSGSRSRSRKVQTSVGPMVGFNRSWR